MRLRDALAVDDHAHNATESTRWGITWGLYAMRYPNGIVIGALIGKGSAAEWHNWHFDDSDIDSAGNMPFIDSDPIKDGEGFVFTRVWFGEDQWFPGH